MNANKMIGKMDPNVLKVLEQFAQNENEFEVLKFKTALFLEFGTPILERETKPSKQKTELTDELPPQKLEAKGNVQLCCTDVTEYNIEKLAALFEKLWPGHGKRKAAQIFEKGNLIKCLSEMQWQTILDPGKKMSKPDLCLRLAEIGINAHIG